MADLVAIHLSQIEMVRDKVDAFAKALWAGLPDYRPDTVREMCDALIPRVKAGQVTVAQLTDAYLRAQAAQLGMKPPPGSVVEADVIDLRGVGSEQVYMRPSATVSAAVGQGKTVQAAAEEGLARLSSLIAMDLQMAKIRQARSTMHDCGAQYYLRVLTGKENCALCMIASTQRYKVKNLLPIHPGCDCTVKMVQGSSPHVNDPELLDQVYNAIDGRSDQLSSATRDWNSYRKLIAVREHGEYGPTLTWKDQHFTGPNQI